MEFRSLAESGAADVRFAIYWFNYWRFVHDHPPGPPALFHAAFRAFDIWKTPAVQRGVDGPQPRHERRAKDYGYYHARAFYWHKSGRLRCVTSVAEFSSDSEVRSRAVMGESALRCHDGSWDRGGRLANHSHAWSQNGQAPTGARIRSGNNCRVDHSGCERLGNSAFDHTCHLDFHHGRGRSEAIQRRQMDRRRTNHLGMGLDAAGNGVTRLYSLSRRSTLTHR